jgi:hypothetical protein
MKCCISENPKKIAEYKRVRYMGISYVPFKQGPESRQDTTAVEM